ncbi:MAG: PAS domain-containing protein [Candidatus Doudnabacteria bacterium]|nr:PAS domain-containing protein [Candidatus Doudnabacteria bacterium]
MLIHADPLHLLQKDLQILLGHLQNKREELKFEQAHRDTILESIDDGIAVLDERDLIQYLNKKFASMFGTLSDGWNGMHISKLYNFLLDQGQVADVGKLSSVYYSVLGKRNLIADRCEIILKKEQTKYINVYTGPVSHPEKVYLGRVWKFQDVSQEKELAQMRMEFLSLASHQLRTPLTAIWGYLKMIDGGDFGDIPDKLQKPIGVLMHSTNKMRDLINDLLDVSRLESGKLVPKIERIDLGQIISDEVETQGSTAGLKSLQVELIPHGDTVLMSDASLVKEMVKNYLSNAIKYSKPNGVIVIHTSKVGKDVYRVAVKDQGIGIPADQQVHLFEKFYRADNVSTSEYEGTGLGLYFVKQCAAALGGRVGFHSQEHQGSEFWFDIPSASQSDLNIN